MARSSVFKRRTPLYNMAEAQESVSGILPRPWQQQQQQQQQQQKEQQQRQKQPVERPVQTAIAPKRPSAQSALTGTPVPLRDADKQSPHASQMSAACLSSTLSQSTSGQGPSSPGHAACAKAASIMERRRCLPPQIGPECLCGEEASGPLSNRSSIASSSSGTPFSPGSSLQALRTRSKESTFSHGSTRSSSKVKPASWDATQARRASSKEAASSRCSSLVASIKTRASQGSCHQALAPLVPSRAGAQEAPLTSHADYSKPAPGDLATILPHITKGSSMQSNTTEDDVFSEVVSNDSCDLEGDSRPRAHTSFDIESVMKRLKEEDDEASQAEMAARSKSWHTSQEIDEQVLNMLNKVPEQYRDQFALAHHDEENWTSRQSPIREKSFAERILEEQARADAAGKTVSNFGVNQSRTAAEAGALARVRERIQEVSRLAYRLM